MRTRGATARAAAARLGIQDRDRVLLDRAGNPISPNAPLPRKLSNDDVVPTPPQAVPELEPPVTRYLCNDKTMRRDLDAWQLAQLLALAMGSPLEISLTPEEFMRLPPDVKANFLPVRGGA